jgi:ribonucleoside-diphosphate reductase beta chain
MDTTVDKDTGHDAVASPLALYGLWEQNNWRIADLGLEAERGAWQALRPFTRQEITKGMVRFFVGETAVTQTLAPLAHAAPDLDSQLYLCTQLADEARHQLFFATYLQKMEGDTRPMAAFIEAKRRELPASLNSLLEVELTRATDAVRQNPQDEVLWCTAVAIYHLLIEGVLAVDALKVLRSLSTAVGTLPALGAGLVNVSRDESRHVAFGIEAVRRAVRRGHGGAISGALLKILPDVVSAFIGPEEFTAVPALPLALKVRATQLSELWSSSLTSLGRRLELAGQLAPQPGPPASPDARLIEDLGYHSLALVELAVALEAEFGLKPIEGDDALDLVTVGNLEAYITRMVGATP